MAIAGIGSRRKNDELILSGAVKINGKIVQELGTKVHVRRDKVTVNGQWVEIREKVYYIMLNKPKDCITTLSDEKGRTSILDYVHVKDRIFPIGRLDRNTTGILLLTNDGELSNLLIHPKREIERSYRVRLDQSVNDAHIRAIRKGVRLEDGVAKPDRIVTFPGTKSKEFLLTIREGRNREVRRMFEALGYEVKGLERISFAGLTTEGLARGKWRMLSHQEVEHLRKEAGL
ncbi:MAG: pseudouridine synthase [bacterium]